MVGSLLHDMVVSIFGTFVEVYVHIVVVAVMEALDRLVADKPVEDKLAADT